MQMPETDSSEYASLLEFVATSGRTRSHPRVAQRANELESRLYAPRTAAMTQSIVALAKAALGKMH